MRALCSRRSKSCQLVALSPTQLSTSLFSFIISFVLRVCKISFCLFSIAMDDLPLFGTVIDKSQVPSIHQKRIVAFVNHFTIQTSVFLNQFITECEHRFIDFETKLKRVEAALAIVEAKLDSIPGLETTASPSQQENPKADVIPETPSPPRPTEERVESIESAAVGVAAKDDIRYKKYFKMVHVGVPASAVKLKMKAEGLDESLLE
jgi:WASH complex subunit CCDC53